MKNLLSIILLQSPCYAVSLKQDSYSSEEALAQLDVSGFIDPCLCFKYDDWTSPKKIPELEIEVKGGKFVIPTEGECLNDAGEVEVTNQSCAYKLWMCACWANQADGCLCARENPDETVTIIKPK